MTPSSLLAAALGPDADALPADRVAAESLCAEAPRLRRLVHRLLGWRSGAADLDDVVQDVLLAAWRHRRTFRGDAALATWLTQIALRTVQNHVRRRTTRQRLVGWLVCEPANQPNVDDERLDRTRAAMQRLPHGDREVLVLRYLEQRGIDEVAAVLACSRAAVDARLSRARARLRELLPPEAP
ncbi:MAG: sigma-70 family RNA polymerase sigma factor [Planctomycetes bacterium]|nr:sigma-70 family RNA polymerase sigma factor [Planctomycetota bacterium]